MVFIPLQSLQNLCGIHVAYLMWTRHDLFQRLPKQELFEEYYDVVITNIKNLPVPEKIKLVILKHVKPAGKHLISFLALWLSKLQPENSQKCLTEEMLIECLILNADGLINQRKTAEKLLMNCLLNNIFAFRLACINFLEKEVLKLWPFVKRYFLNKIMLESEFGVKFFPSNPAVRKLNDSVELYDRFTEISISSKTTESDEVLLWISYCVSKEIATNIKELPYFEGEYEKWHEYFLNSELYCSNIACLEYFHSFHNTEIKLNYRKTFEYFFSLDQEDLELPCFVFLFMLSNNEKKVELFRRFPRKILSQFLQWPLSLTFVEKTEELWNLIPEKHKKWVFVKIFAILFHKNKMILPFRHKFREYRVFGDRLLYTTITGIHSVDHLKNIWVKLWKISLDSYKSPIFDNFVFPSILYSCGNETFLKEFWISGLKEKLIHLFLSNGGAILELYEGTNMESSLRNLITKYIPEGFGDADRRYIPVSVDYFAQSEQEIPQEPRNTPKILLNRFPEKFLDFIKTFLFSSDGIDKSLFYK